MVETPVKPRNNKQAVPTESAAIDIFCSLYLHHNACSHSNNHIQTITPTTPSNHIETYTPDPSSEAAVLQVFLSQ